MSGMSPMPPSVAERIENSGSRIPARRRRRCASFLTTRAGAAAASRAAVGSSGWRSTASARPATSYVSAHGVPAALPRSPVSSSSSHGPPSASAGSLKAIGSWCAFIRISRPSSSSRSPRSSVIGIASPPSTIASAEIHDFCQSCGVISTPSGRSQARSFDCDSQMKSPTKNRRCCRIECTRRSPIRRRVNSSSPRRRSSRRQSYQEISLSWQ